MKIISKSLADRKNDLQMNKVNKIIQVTYLQ